MDFSFNANTFKDMLHNSVAEYLKDEIAGKDVVAQTRTDKSHYTDTVGF